MFVQVCWFRVFGWKKCLHCARFQRCEWRHRRHWWCSASSDTRAHLPLTCWPCSPIAFLLPNESSNLTLFPAITDIFSGEPFNSVKGERREEEHVFESRSMPWPKFLQHPSERMQSEVQSHLLFAFLILEHVLWHISCSNHCGCFIFIYHVDRCRDQSHDLLQKQALHIWISWHGYLSSHGDKISTLLFHLHAPNLAATTISASSLQLPHWGPQLPIANLEKLRSHKLQQRHLIPSSLPLLILKEKPNSHCDGLLIWCVGNEQQELGRIVEWSERLCFGEWVSEEEDGGLWLL